MPLQLSLSISLQSSRLCQSLKGCAYVNISKTMRVLGSYRCLEGFRFYLAVPFECRSLNVISFAVLLLKSYIRSLARSLLKFKFEKYMSHFLKKLLFFSWGCVDMCLFLLRTLAKR
uniref:Uncharacterized protein n=1 Tax=Anas platyrhynchos platyrhynchos TaxID=8840 RepID=A0A493T5S1_ANAPP